ncbi:MAG: hypothetical protein ABSC13_05150 [Dehalococcoidia bacterium]|jgi:hypothetical protein
MRLGFHVLLAVAAAFSLAALPACGGSKSNPAASPTSQGISQPKWLRFDGGPPTDTEKSLWLAPQELSNRADLSLVLPNYLPNGINQRFIRDDIVPASGGASGSEAHVFLVTDYGTTAPTIAIYESKPKTAQETGQCDPKDCQTSDISGTSVTCRIIIPSPGVVVSQPPPPTATPPELNPRLRCEWQTDQMWAQVEFGWTLTEASPDGVPADLRADAMQVVTSMIEDPFTINPSD